MDNHAMVSRKIMYDKIIDMVKEHQN
jgi:hypothetical protein